MIRFTSTALTLPVHTMCRNGLAPMPAMRALSEDEFWPGWLDLVSRENRPRWSARELGRVFACFERVTDLQTQRAQSNAHRLARDAERRCGIS